jgi:hypothetical protein
MTPRFQLPTKASVVEAHPVVAAAGTMMRTLLSLVAGALGAAISGFGSYFVLSLIEAMLEEFVLPHNYRKERLWVWSADTSPELQAKLEAQMDPALIYALVEEPWFATHFPSWSGLVRITCVCIGVVAGIWSVRVVRRKLA